MIGPPTECSVFDIIVIKKGWAEYESVARLTRFWTCGRRGNADMGWAGGADRAVGVLRFAG